MRLVIRHGDKIFVVEELLSGTKCSSLFPGLVDV